MASKELIIVGGLAAAAAGALAYVVVGDGGGEPTGAGDTASAASREHTGDRADDREAPSADRGATGDTRAPDRRARTRSQPSLEDESPPALESGTANDDGEKDYREYRRDDGTIVRDHRKGDRSPSLGRVPDSRRLPPTAERVTPNTVLAVRNALRPEVWRCESEHVSGELDPKAAVRARVVFSVSGGALEVEDASVKSRGVPGAALNECIAQAARGLALEVPDAEDVSGHPIELPYRLRSRAKK